MKARLAGLRGRRAVLPGLLPLPLCRTLAAYVDALAVRGYRPGVSSLTLHDLLLAAPECLPAVLAARQLCWDAAEAHFGLEAEVWVETTSLISWAPGASLGWHHDSNQPYLAARHLSVVAYLTSAGADFMGGAFCWRDGPPPLRVEPEAGLVLVYGADDSAVHCVERIEAGTRTTLTLWLTLDEQHQEDAKVLGHLRSGCVPGSGLPCSMYAVAEQPGEGDYRLARTREQLGLAIEPCEQHGAQPTPQDMQPVLQQQQQRQLAGAGSAAAGCCNVRCCVHGAAAAGELHLGSRQHALLALAWLHWHVGERVAAAACEAGAGSCAACRAVALLPSAAALVSEHVAAGLREFERLRAKWPSLGTLVPSA